MKKTLTALAAAGVVAASLIATAPAASASGCVSSTLTTGLTQPATVAYKAASGCRDLNLTYAHDTSGQGRDYYEGWYKNSSGNWTAGSAGWIQVPDGSYAAGRIVLVSDLTSGRAFGVTSLFDSGDTVVITH
ncbi:hypothetical protein [Streptomyces sp. NPDC020362]|uniref:hypothetical protein n=1 Tax=unclassified Streptomyces TaxID=2593676 RepID=UPI0033C21CF7